MKQAQDMQNKVTELQQKMLEIELPAEVAGGLVQGTFNGKGMLRSIDIDKSLLKEDEKETLEDLIIALINQGQAKAEQEFSQQMQSITGGLSLPPGVKLPF